METDENLQLERQIFELNRKLNALRKNHRQREVPDYPFQTVEGDTSLLALFAGMEKLLVIHNMGEGCRYCTLWADGFNGFLPHLESALSVVLVSKDPPRAQRRFANSRRWRFRLASHGGGDYLRDQSVLADADNIPGALVYEREGDRIFRKNACVFGPGDLYCSMWNLLGLAGLDEAQWTPQFRYWRRPEELDDGGANLVD